VTDTALSSPPGSGTPASGAARIAYALRWPALLVILGGEVIDLLDALITSIVGPTIVRDLGGGDATIQWLTAGYTLAMAAGLLFGGRLGDRFGRRRMFLIGIAGFTLASMLCATALHPEALVGFRVLQGFLGAMMIPQGLGMIKEMFPPDEVGKAFGAFGPIMGISSVGGPILAGWLIGLDLFGWGWRVAFAINVPIGIAAFVAGLLVLPASRPDRTARPDLVSSVVAAAAMALLVFPLIQGRELGWPWWCLVMIALGLALLAALIGVSRSRGRAGLPVLITPSLFGKRAFTMGLATGTALFAAMNGTTLVLMLFVQFGLHWSPLLAGLVGIGQAVGMVVGFIASQPLMGRFGGRAVMHVGEALAAVGLVGFVATLLLAGEAISIPLMSPALAVTGLGLGLTMSPFFDIVLAGVDDAESGSASGALSSVQQLGGSFGIAVLGTVFFQALGQATSLSDFQWAATAAYGVAIGLFLITFGLTWALPRRARGDGAGGH